MDREIRTSDWIGYSNSTSAGLLPIERGVRRQRRARDMASASSYVANDLSDSSDMPPTRCAGGRGHRPRRSPDCSRARRSRRRAATGRFCQVDKVPFAARIFHVKHVFSGRRTSTLSVWPSGLTKPGRSRRWGCRAQAQAPRKASASSSARRPSIVLTTSWPPRLFRRGFGQTVPGSSH